MPGEHIVTLTFKADLSFEQVGFFVAGLDDLALASSFREVGDEWQCLWTIDEDVDPDALKARLILSAELNNLPDVDLSDLSVEPLPDINWLAASYEGFQPFSLGPFYVYGSHHRESAVIPGGALALEIDAATAFGSGEHGTTSGCMLAMDALRKKGFDPDGVLDMGTGSGILAIAAAKLWPESQCYAVDNDPECILVTDRHAAANHIPAAQIISYVSEGFDDGRVKEDGPYDLVIANILAGPLILMAADLSAVTAKKGYLILSGLLETQKDDVMAAYRAQKMTLVQADQRDEWAILTLTHGA